MNTQVFNPSPFPTFCARSVAMALLGEDKVFTLDMMGLVVSDRYKDKVKFKEFQALKKDNEELRALLSNHQEIPEHLCR